MVAGIGEVGGAHGAQGGAHDAGGGSPANAVAYSNSHSRATARDSASFDGSNFSLRDLFKGKGAGGMGGGVGGSEGCCCAANESQGAQGEEGTDPSETGNGITLDLGNGMSVTFSQGEDGGLDIKLTTPDGSYNIDLTRDANGQMSLKISMGEGEAGQGAGAAGGSSGSDEGKAEGASKAHGGGKSEHSEETDESGKAEGAGKSESSGKGGGSQGSGKSEGASAAQNASLDDLLQLLAKLLGQDGKDKNSILSKLKQFISQLQGLVTALENGGQGLSSILGGTDAIGGVGGSDAVGSVQLAA